VQEEAVEYEYVPRYKCNPIKLEENIKIISIQIVTF